MKTTVNTNKVKAWLLTSLQEFNRKPELLDDRNLFDDFILKRTSVFKGFKGNEAAKVHLSLYLLNQKSDFDLIFN